MMPDSYYSFQGGINWVHVILQLLCQDSIQYMMHYLEHKANAKFYQMSHKPHHRFTNPKLFDAFNGSPTDTFCMILIPLFVTAHLIHVNVWSYMTFGTLYANWLCLIHAEFPHPWDGLFRWIGFGTAADHHVHHKLFVYNYGHLFMYIYLYNW
jgi:sterol desaturase/sphingolipid hydroxylase (fatty acid hydroxylase superfamily)